MARNKAQSDCDNTTRKKGKLVELIVASMHENRDLIVERNVNLPSLRNAKRKREIDIILSGYLDGYPIKMAIECKNHKNDIDVPYIDAFIGKLQDVGIPPQLGIFIATSRFTSGALNRAKEVGITPLILTGLTSDHITAKIFQAIQSIIYLLLEITNIQIRCCSSKINHLSQMIFIYGKTGTLKATLPDLLWKKWIDGEIPTNLGNHEIKIDIPDNWGLFIDGKFEPIISATILFRIIGCIVRIPGVATQHTLTNPTNKEIDRFITNVNFDIPQKKVEVSTFFDENILQVFFQNQPENIRLSIGRVRLPRIKFNFLYWPLSFRAFSEFRTLVINKNNDGNMPTDQEIAAIEGSDLKTIWDPIWEENPYIKFLSKK